MSDIPTVPSGPPVDADIVSGASIAMAETKPPSSIKLYHEKGNFFRVIHADGAIGGLTPTREIFMSLFSQRAAIPKEIEQALTTEGHLGEEVGRVGKSGIFRELEVGVVMTPATARKIAEWLQQQATIAEQTASPVDASKGTAQ
jgi:hypothetical protein